PHKHRCGARSWSASACPKNRSRSRGPCRRKQSGRDGREVSTAASGCSEEEGVEKEARCEAVIVVTQAPLKTLELVLTSQCNLRCGYCFENAKQDGRMSWEVAKASLDAILR